MDDTTSDKLLTTIELAELVRVSPRQLDHWTHAGLLPSAYGTHPGKGFRRLWSPPEVQRARVFASLAHAGVDIRAIGEAIPRALFSDELFVVQLGELTVTGRLT